MGKVKEFFTQLEDENIKKYETPAWTWIKNKKSAVKQTEITGKYLFFSNDRQLLLDICPHIILEHDLPKAKVSVIPNNNGHLLFVACFYDSGSKLSQKMNDFASLGVVYKGYKSNEDTEKGIYKYKTTTK